MKNRLLLKLSHCWRAMGPTRRGAMAAALGALTTPASAIHQGIADVTAQYASVGTILPTATHGRCSGTMLSQTVMLTAAQCVADAVPPQGYEFSLGDGLSAHATEIRMYPGFISPEGINLAFDLALVALNPVEVGAWAAFEPMALGTTWPVHASAVTAVGFGETTEGVGGGIRRVGHLLLSQYVGTEGQPGVWLGDAFMETVPADLSNHMFCAGDAGGPLVYDNAVVGIASFRTVATCDETGPGYYVNLRSFTDWIGANLSEMDRPAAVPLPPTLALLALGGALLGATRRRQAGRAA